MTEDFATFSHNALDEIKKAGGEPAVDVKKGQDAAMVSAEKDRSDIRKPELTK